MKKNLKINKPKLKFESIKDLKLKLTKKLKKLKTLKEFKLKLTKLKLEFE